MYQSLESFKEFSHPSNQRDCPFKYVGMGICLHCDEEARYHFHHKVFFFWGVDDLGIVSKRTGEFLGNLDKKRGALRKSKQKKKIYKSCPPVCCSRVLEENPG